MWLPLWAPFTKCITRIDGTTIDDAEDLDLVMLVYSLIECISSLTQQIILMLILQTPMFLNLLGINILSILEYIGGIVTQSNPNQSKGILKHATITVS